MRDCRREQQLAFLLERALRPGLEALWNTHLAKFDPAEREAVLWAGISGEGGVVDYAVSVHPDPGFRRLVPAAVRRIVEEFLREKVGAANDKPDESHGTQPVGVNP